MKRITRNNIGEIDQYTKLYIKGTYLRDDSLINSTITNHGITISSEQSKFNASSLYFNNVGNDSSKYIALSNLDLNNYNWAISWWEYRVASQDKKCTLGEGNSNTGILLHYDNSGVPSLYIRYTDSSQDVLIMYPGSVKTGSWYHFACVRSGTNINVYVNGIRTLNQTGITKTIKAFTTVELGRWQNDGYSGLNGYISDLKIDIGTDRGWTGQLIKDYPPNLSNVANNDIVQYTKLWIPGYGANGKTDIKDKSVYGKSVNLSGNVSVSTSQGKFNGSSIYLDGITSNFISIPRSDDFDFSGSIECVISFWLYKLTSNATTNIIHSNITTGSGGPNGGNWSIYIYGDGKVAVGLSYVSELVTGGGALPSNNAWHHVAVSKTGTLTKIYINGVVQASGDSSALWDYSLNPVRIGPYNDRTNDAFYISDIVIARGSSLGFNGSTIPVPTKPFSLDGIPQSSHTSVLFDGVANGIDKYTRLYMPLSESSNTFTDKSFYGRTITNNNVVTSTTQTKFGGSSASFNGSSSYFSLQMTDMAFGTSDFTISYWIYYTSFYNYITVMSTPRGAGGFNIGSDNAQKLFWYDSGARQLESASNVFTSTNTWYHVTYTRKGNTLNGYVNGVLVATNTTNTNFTASPLRIGCLDGSGEFFTGYMSEILINNGVCLYDGNFTPPTKPAEIPFTITKSQFSPSTMANPVLYVKGYSTTNNGTNIFDSSVYSRCITNTLATTRTTNQKYGPSSMYFNGSAYLQMPDSGQEDLGTNDFVLQCWFYLSAYNGGAQRLISAGKESDGAYNLWSLGIGNHPAWGGGARINFAYYNGGGYSDFSSTSLSMNALEWNHISCVRSGTNIYFYLNGTRVYSGNIGSPVLNGGSSGFLVGTRWYGAGPSEYFNGYLSEVMVVNGSNMGYTGSTIPVPTGSLKFR